VNTGIIANFVFENVTLAGNLELAGTANLSLFLEGDNKITDGILVPSTA